MAEFSVRADLRKRTLVVRMSGTFTEEDMLRWARAYRKETERFKGTRHLVVADMRGMKTPRPQVAEIMGRELGHARRNGVALRAHVSDDTVQRLQAARIARQNAEGDDVTVDAVSIEEAHEIVNEGLGRLDDTLATSLRLP